MSYDAPESRSQVELSDIIAGFARSCQWEFVGAADQCGCCIGVDDHWGAGALALTILNSVQYLALCPCTPHAWQQPK